VIPASRWIYGHARESFRHGNPAQAFNVTPRWRRRLKYLIAIGLLVFGYIVVRRILEILPPGIFG